MISGIDIYDGDWGIDLSKTGASFVIVKASQGTAAQDHYKALASAALKNGQLLGLYHFVDVRKGAEAEAEFFAGCAKPYLGSAALFLDWEDNDVTGQKNTTKGPSYAKAFLDRLFEVTGVRAGIYMNQSCAESYDWSAVAKLYPLWGAQYLYKYYNSPVTGFVSDPTLASGWGAWGVPTIYQYTCRGRLPGFGGDLDLDVFYGSKADWAKLGTAAPAEAPEAASGLSPQQRAVEIWRHIQEHDASHGYSQPGREGTGAERITLSDGFVATTHHGDYDCSRLAIEGYMAQGIGTGGATYTGNMSALLKAGFVQVSRANRVAGDIGNNVSRGHAVCYIGNGEIIQASSSETGGIDGKVGDQTGGEINRRSDYTGSQDGWVWYHYAGAGATTGGKDVDQLAREVIAGQWGNGSERRTALGSLYDAVQKRVNELLAGDSASTGEVAHVDVRGIQKAVKAAQDNVWGPDTEKRVNAVRMASAWSGYQFPYGVAYAQGVVGTATDGSWGPKSRAAHDACVIKIQKALNELGYGLVVDGIWGPNTDAASKSARDRAQRG